MPNSGALSFGASCIPSYLRAVKSGKVWRVMEASLAPKAQKNLRNWPFWRMDFSICSHLLYDVEGIMLSLAFEEEPF